MSKTAVHVQEDFYISLADDTRSTWSLRFDSEDQMVSFLRSVALARYASTIGRAEELIVQGATRFDCDIHLNFMSN